MLLVITGGHRCLYHGLGTASYFLGDPGNLCQSFTMKIGKYDPCKIAVELNGRMSGIK